jgi:hypothetical protein
MGEVKDTIKGKGSSIKALDGPLCDRVLQLRDEISRLTIVKDEDVLAEGDGSRAENQRKASVLRAAYDLLNGAHRVLELY